MNAHKESFCDLNGAIKFAAGYLARLIIQGSSRSGTEKHLTSHYVEIPTGILNIVLFVTGATFSMSNKT